MGEKKGSITTRAATLAPAHPAWSALPLPDQVEPRRARLARESDEGVVQRARALAPAEHPHGRKRRIDPGRERSRQRDQRRDRASGDLHVGPARQLRGRALELDAREIRPAGEKAGRDAGSAVLLLEKDRPPGERRGQTAGRRVTPPHDHVRVELGDESPRRRHRDRQPRREGRVAPPPGALEPRGTQDPERQSRARVHGPIRPTVTADQRDPRGSRTRDQLARQRQGRGQVTPRAPASDHDAHFGLRVMPRHSTPSS